MCPQSIWNVRRIGVTRPVDASPCGYARDVAIRDNLLYIAEGDDTSQPTTTRASTPS